MGDKTAHFDFREFTCTCGCCTNLTKDELITAMENVYMYLDKTDDGVTVRIYGVNDNVDMKMVYIDGEWYFGNLIKLGKSN